MLLTYIDVETTDLIRSIDGGTRRVYPDILSCAYLTMNSNWRRVDSGILYFDDDSIADSTAGAFRTHGLTRDFLSQYRDKFSDNLRKLYKLVSRGNLVGHNIKAFDAHVIIKFLEKYDYHDFGIETVHDTYTGMRAYMKQTFEKTEVDRRLKRGSANLSNVCLQLNIQDEFLEKFYEKYFPEDVQRNRAHNAGTDVLRTYFVHRYALRNNIMEL